jgi:hypothetical protein|tara:strand:- start:183 stop:644 length:462 start_codon:yes stop_codon:yes gene_type:complete
MAEFLSSSERASIASNLLDLHDTFGRDIIVYKEAQKVIISTDPSYNYLYNTASSPNKTIENTPVKKVFKARIRYDTDRSLEYFGDTDAQVKVAKPDANSLVRIKLKVEDYTYIKDAKRVELDGRMFHVESDPRAHGLFDVIQFYTLYLRPIEV